MTNYFKPKYDLNTSLYIILTNDINITEVFISRIEVSKGFTKDSNKINYEYYYSIPHYPEYFKINIDSEDKLSNSRNIRLYESVEELKNNIIVKQ
jgi:hypothetical protein